jgi:hypothetical protein
MFEGFQHKRFHRLKKYRPDFATWCAGHALVRIHGAEALVESGVRIQAMKSRWTKWWLLLLTALWLPLQTVTAFVMPLGLLTSSSAQASEHEAAMPCHAHESDDAANMTTDDTDQPDCGRCGVCHLAAAGYMPAAVMVPLVFPAAHVFSAAPLRTPHSQVPAPLEDPPKHLS